VRHGQSGHAARSLLHDDFDASQEREAAPSFKTWRPIYTAHDKLTETDTGMKFHTEYLTFNTRKHREYIHITPQVEKILHASGVTSGMVLVSAMHITAGVYVNDDERGLIQDIDKWLEQLAPFNEAYLHHETGEDNGDSHLKALLIHHQVILPVKDGKLLLGTWQRVFYAEFDGQRSKRVVVAVMGE
jgi:secondary thiamine-phosphate synthase enzyme